MRGDTEVGLMVLFVLGGIALGNVMALNELPKWIETLANAGATLLAAYLGASYAFRLSDEKTRKQEVQDQLRRGNKVIFYAIRIFNQFTAVQTQFIAPQRNSEFRAFEILPMVGSLGGFQPFNPDDVAVFLDSENPDLASEVIRLEMEVAATLDLISARSRTHLEMQVKLDAVPAGTVLNQQAIEAIIGQGMVQQLKMSTDDMVRSVDTILATSSALIPKLSADLNARFSGHRIIGMEVPAQQSVEGLTSSPTVGTRSESGR